MFCTNASHEESLSSAALTLSPSTCFSEVLDKFDELDDLHASSSEVFDEFDKLDDFDVLSLEFFDEFNNVDDADDASYKTSSFSACTRFLLVAASPDFFNTNFSFYLIT